MRYEVKLYISAVIILGLIPLSIAATHWDSRDPMRYGTFCVLALCAATLKIRLPQIEGTISPSFLFVLIGIADFTFPETVVICCASVLVQCIWKAKRKPAAVQVVFNIATLLISASLAYTAYRALSIYTGGRTFLASFAMAGTVLFVSNTLLVSTVLCLLQEKPLGTIWQACHFWAFPYYVAGSAIAGLMTSVSHTSHWYESLLILPLAYLADLYYRRYIGQMQPVES